ncbi:MAG: septal ring lytic transglycosylase RlpA family protein, partial [Pseudomonadota bacterium]|nr:septal ring lytic transglycosylase RlpA family protein [Pseudomonadota bacterium]
MGRQRLLVVLLPLTLAACATSGSALKDTSNQAAHGVIGQPGGEMNSVQPLERAKVSPYAPATEDLATRGNYVAGGLYLPGVADTVPDEIPDVDAIPEPEVRDEPRSRGGNRDYSVLGKRYQVMDQQDGYVESGQASYYGKKFHGRRTSSQEVYDMYAFTAAHKTLPLPSYARVTNLDNGKSIVVRVNDRGPFHAGRVIDLSYAAAVKLGYRDRGTARVEVRALKPGDIDATRVVKQPKVEASAMDRLVKHLPEALADAGRVVVAPPEPARNAREDQRYRFDMRQDGRVMQADEFDAWMKSRRVRVATGRPGKPDAAPVVIGGSLPTESVGKAIAAAPP